MKKKSSKHAPKKAKQPRKQAEQAAGKAEDEIKIEFEQKPTLAELEQAIDEKLTTRATDLFRTSNKLVIIIEEG